MLQKIMGDTPLMPAPTHHVVQGMGGVVQQTRDYTNYPGAIGYSFRMFVTQMLQPGGIHLLAVDGVAPTPTSIGDASYPYSTEFYAATLGPPQGEAKRFIDWIRSEQGQTLVERTGYVRLPREGLHKAQSAVTRRSLTWRLRSFAPSRALPPRVFALAGR